MANGEGRLENGPRVTFSPWRIVGCGLGVAACLTRLLLLVTAGAALACGGGGGGPVVWYPDPAMSWGPSGGVTAPTDGSRYPGGSEVACTVTTVTDMDRKYTPGENPPESYHEDTLTYTWYRYPEIGSWKNGNTGQSVTWIAPSAPNGGVTITCTISDAAVIPPGETGSRDDTNLTRSVTVKVYTIGCVKIEATSDVDIYWENDPHYSDKVWGADQNTFESSGTISENWLRPRIADIFQPTTQHYTLVATLARYPTCTTNQTPTTTLWQSWPACAGRGEGLRSAGSVYEGLLPPPPPPAPIAPTANSKRKPAKPASPSSE